MPVTTLTAGSTARAADVNGNFALCVLTDTARTITVTHTYTASQTFTGGWTAGAACTVSTGGLTVTAGGLTVTAGGLTVSASGAAITGNSTVTGTLTVTAAVSCGAANNFTFTGRSTMKSPSDGVLTLMNSAETDFTRLQFGGTTSSFPALRRVGSTLSVELADISAAAGFACAALTATGQIKTTVTTQQLSLNYDASNHLAVTVASDGAVTYNATGAGAAHVFSDLVTANAGLTILTTASPQLGVRYDVNNHMEYQVSSAGVVVWNSTAGGVSGAGDLKINFDAIGFYNTAPATKQAITGTRDSNAALASLLTALATLGLITDSSTA